MDTRLAIGDFSRMTHLSVKALRHYHQVGLLEPAEVDPVTGYRYYVTRQVPTAQVIRRFRELDMPVEQVGAVLATEDPAERNRLILAHLDRMQEQLAQTRSAVESLRALLERPDPPPVPVRHRTVPDTTVLAITETVDLADLGPWWLSAFNELHDAVRTHGIVPDGPYGALFATALFADERGEIVAFVPVAEPPAAAGRARGLLLPGVELAVSTHHGSHAEADRTYGALGTYVAEHALGVEGPVRESYLVDRFDTPDADRWRTEIGWPVFRTGSP